MIVEVTSLRCVVVANVRKVIVGRYFDYYRISELAKDIEVFFIVGRSEEIFGFRIILSSWIDVVG